MPWVRFDDQFSIHRKVSGMTDAAFRLHVSAVFWCARNLTDGFVSEEDLDDVSARVRTPSRFAAECVKRGAWHIARESCDSERCIAPVDEDGWVIHDYLEYQFSKEQVIHNRETNKERQKRHRDTRNGVSNGDRNGVTNNTPSRPVPYVSTGSYQRAGPGHPQDPKPDLSSANGAASRQPPPVSEAIEAALRPGGRHARTETTT